MRRTWIVVAQRAEARIFVRDAHHRQPMLHSEVGVTKASHEPDSLAGRRTTHAEVFNFARELAVLLDDACGHEYNDLVLVAESSFLELLRGVLRRDTIDAVTAMIPRDLDPCGSAAPHIASRRETLPSAVGWSL